MNTTCPLEQDQGFIMKIICLAHQLERVAEQYFFAPKGLSMSSGRMIMCLHHAPKTPTELAHLLDGKKSNVTQRVSLLKKAGLVSMNMVSTDKRSVRLELTEKGHELAEVLEGIFKTHIDLLEASLSKEEQESFTASLNTINNALDEFLQTTRG